MTNPIQPPILSLVCVIVHLNSQKRIVFINVSPPVAVQLRNKIASTKVISFGQQFDGFLLKCDAVEIVEIRPHPIPNDNFLSFKMIDFGGVVSI